MPAMSAWLSLVGIPKYQAAVAQSTIAKRAAQRAIIESFGSFPKSTIFAIVWATVALMDVITNTPRKLNTAAIRMAFFGAMDRVDTHVAIAFGASVQPFTKITPKVNTTMIKRIGFVWMLSIKSENVIVIDCTSTLSS